MTRRPPGRHHIGALVPVSVVAGALLSGLVVAPARAELRIDGHIDEPEWTQARHVKDFVLTQPLSGAPSPYPTDAWILATPQGLAIAFRNTQPANVRRTRQRTQRDEDAPVDRVNLVVDFDGTAGTGYNFTLTRGGGIKDQVVTNENIFSKDWDGVWQHAVSEDGDTWSAELLIPWYIAPMHQGVDGHRTIGIYLDRVIGATGERVAWPYASNSQPRYLSNFSRIQLPAYSQKLLAVTPYVVSVTDRVAGQTHFDTGADIVWKPSSSFQLTATLNPDFGQVESDSLVVNFGATETFFSDKRPFFTENQSLFNVPFGVNNSALVYTRRVGGLTDDRMANEAGDVTAALKLNGSFANINYGVFAATEADPVGRDFYALRLTRSLGLQDLGLMTTYVHHPFLDRDATVLAFDHHWKPNAKWNVVTNVVESHITQEGRRAQDSGMQVLVDNELNRGWRQEVFALHLGDRLQLNDFGFLDRNNFNYLRYSFNHRVTNLPPNSSYRSHDWAYGTSTRYNDHGTRIYNAIRMTRNSFTRAGGAEYFELAYLTSGTDDLITRGHGDVRLPPKLYGYYERSWPQRGHWSFFGRGRIDQNGLAGIGYPETELFLQPTYHLNEDLSINIGVDADFSPDWLVWHEDNLLGTYRARQISLSSEAQWLLGSRQELRIKLEAIALDARRRQAWRVSSDGTPQRVNETVPNFNLSNFGFQVRYRYELAPLSDLFVVYSRGGLALAENSDSSLFRLLSNTFSLRDSEQFLIKLSFRFSN